MSKAKAGDLKSRILDSIDLERIPVVVPEWGIGEGEAFIQALDGESRYRLAKLVPTAATAGDADSYICEAYVCEGLIDADGVAVFDINDRQALARKNPEVVERLYEMVMKASGMDADTQADAEKK